MSTTTIIKPQEGFQEKFVRSNVDVCFAGGVLNPQPLDSKVATPQGFVSMKDIEVGDVIYDTKGGLQNVNYVLDKGVQPCVEFTLSDGRKVKSALSHNWEIIDKHGRKRQLTAEQIIYYMRKNEKGVRINKTNYHLPLCTPVVGESKEWEIHPYVLGFLLGDGCFSEKATYCTITTIDVEIINKLQSLGYNVVSCNRKKDNIHYYIKDRKVKQYLKNVGLWGKRSYEKFIPEEYKNSSENDRLLLIQGLFDADGTCSKTHQVAFGTTSKKLSDDVRDIIYSLGGKCSVSTKKETVRRWDNNISYCRKAYINYPKLKDDSVLFFLQRKKNNTISDKQRVEKVGITIMDYTILPDCEMRCINVSGEEHLYLTDGYVVTCNCGKTAGAVLMCAEPSTDPKFRGVFLRNNLGDLRSGGGILDEFKAMYGDGIDVVESGEPRAVFPSGAKIDVTHIADQTKEKVRQRFKGRQYDLIYFDEMTGFSWDCFVEVCTRNRGTGQWTGKIRGTTNPDRNHWLRTFLDWYIGIDGFIREDREGVVRYFYIAGETVKDVVWGDDKESIYRQCKVDIDRKLARINGKNGKANYKDMIRSFTFYLGRMSENIASIGNNSGYVGAVAMSGGRNAEQLLEGNWNVSPDDDSSCAITSEQANYVALNDDQRNGDMWVTCDLADVGTDNFLCLAWDGFHVIDFLTLGRTTPRQNAERLEMFAATYGVANSHIIYDATRARYINDYIPEAIPYLSGKHPMGMYGRMALRLKDECYLRLVEMIKRQGISMSEKVATRTYEHQLLKEKITFLNEFIEECLVVAFKEVQSGKQTLLTKKEMNQKLGRGRSMDVLDAFAMRMLPVLSFAYGDELAGTYKMDTKQEDNNKIGPSIYDDSFWW